MESSSGATPLATPLERLAHDLCSAYASGYSSTTTEANIATLLPGVNYLGCVLPTTSPCCPHPNHSIGLQWATTGAIVCIGNLVTAGLTSLQELDVSTPSASARCLQNNQACIATEYGISNVASTIQHVICRASMYADAEHALALGSAVVLAVPLYSTAASGDSTVAGAMLVGYVSMDALTNGKAAQIVAQLAAAMTPHLPTLIDDFLPSIFRGLSTAHTSSSTSTLPRGACTSKSTSPERFAPLAMTSWHSSHASSFRSVEGAVGPTPHELGMALLRKQWGPQADGGVDEDDKALPSREIDSLTDASWKVPPPLSRAQSAPDSHRSDDDHHYDMPAQPGPKKRAASVAIPPAHPLASADTAAAEASTPPAPGDPALPSASRNNRWLDARTRLLEEMRSSNQSILSEDALENAQSQEPAAEPLPRRRLGQWLSFLRTSSSKSTARASRSSTDTAGLAAMSEVGEEVAAMEPVRQTALGSFSFGLGMPASGEDSTSEVMEASFSMNVRSPRRTRGSSGGSTPKEFGGSLEINAVAEGRERVPSADLQTKDFAAETRTPRVEQLLAKSWPPATLAAWCACGAATLVALGMFAGRPAMQVAVVVVGGTVARYVGRHPSLLVAASLALAAVAISQSS